MSESIQPGMFFHETTGRMWFVVERVFGDVVTLRSTDADTVIYVVYRKNIRTGLWQWRRAAREPTTGRFFITKCLNGTFEFRGDNGPPFSRFTFGTKPYSTTHIKPGITWL